MCEKYFFITFQTDENFGSWYQIFKQNYVGNSSLIANNSIKELSISVDHIQME